MFYIDNTELEVHMSLDMLYVILNKLPRDTKEKGTHRYIADQQGGVLWTQRLAVKCAPAALSVHPASCGLDWGEERSHRSSK